MNHIVSYTKNDIHSGKFPSLKDLKGLHSDYQHFTFYEGLDSYLIEAFKCDDDVIKMFKQWMGNNSTESCSQSQPRFKLKSNVDYKIFRWDNSNAKPIKFVEKCKGSELYLYDYGSFYFETVEDAIKFCSIMLKAFN